MADPVRQMAYLKTHPGVNIRRHELLTVLVDFIENERDPLHPDGKGTNGATPSELGWWKLFNERAPRYGFRRMAYSTFIDHVRKLIDDGLICKKRGLICVERADWKRPDGLPLIVRKVFAP